VAFSDGYPGEAATTGLGYGDSDRETQALDSSGPGVCPVSAIYLIAGPGTNVPQAEGGVDKGSRSKCIVGLLNQVKILPPERLSNNRQSRGRV
jgi:hypothetical protein